MPRIFDTYVPGCDASIESIVKSHETARENIVNLSIRLGAESAVYKETSITLLHHAVKSKKICGGGLVSVEFRDGEQVCRYDGIEFCEFRQRSQLKLTHKLKSGKWAKHATHYDGELVKFIQPLETKEGKDAQDD